MLDRRKSSEMVVKAAKVKATVQERRRKQDGWQLQKLRKKNRNVHSHSHSNAVELCLSWSIEP